MELPLSLHILDIRTTELVDDSDYKCKCLSKALGIGLLQLAPFSPLKVNNKLSKCQNGFNFSVTPVGILTLSGE